MPAQKGDSLSVYSVGGKCKNNKLVLCEVFSLTICHRFSVFYLIQLRPNRQPSLVHGQSSMAPKHSLEIKDILLSLASCNTGITKLSHTVESFFSVAIWPLTKQGSAKQVSVTSVQVKQWLKQNILGKHGQRKGKANPVKVESPSNQVITRTQQKNNYVKYTLQCEDSELPF